MAETPAPRRKSTRTTKTRAAVNGAPEIARYVFVLYHGTDAAEDTDSLSTSLVWRMRRECDEKIKEPCEQVEIDVWLESPGGDPHAAFKLAVLLRSRSSRLRVVIPDYAKSAATLLTLAADEIYMAPAAELGPLDMQIPREGALIAAMSALDIARSVDDLIETAFDIAQERGAKILQQTRLTRSESLSMMLDFVAKFMEPLVRQVDPTQVHWANTLLGVSVAYADRLLAMRRPDTKPAIARLARSLVENYPTHGFVITRDEARNELKLPVQDLDAYDLKKEACALHESFEDSGVNLITLTSVMDLASGEGE